MQFIIGYSYKLLIIAKSMSVLILEMERGITVNKIKDALTVRTFDVKNIIHLLTFP